MRAVDIRTVPEKIRAAVDQDAEMREQSISDRVLQIVGSRYRVPVELSGRPYTGTSGSTHWNVRMPDELYARLRADATGNKTILGCLLAAVAQEYGIPFSAERRSPSRLSPDVVRDLRRRHASGESIRSLAAEVRVKRETLSRLLRAA